MDDNNQPEPQVPPATTPDMPLTPDIDSTPMPDVEIPGTGAEPQV